MFLHVLIKYADIQRINLSVYALSVKKSGSWIPCPNASTCKPNKWRSHPVQIMAAAKTDN